MTLISGNPAVSPMMKWLGGYFAQFAVLTGDLIVLGCLVLFALRLLY